VYWLICIIRASALEAVRENLAEIGCLGLTVGHIQDYSSPNNFASVRVEIACTEGELKLAIDAICTGARHENGSRIDDGRILIFSLDDVIRIRTGESGKSAI